jgi:patatin-related protein
MREKELRIALVCFGGVSLAVYMHGISKEILKLVRASSALFDITDRTARARATFFDSVDKRGTEYDTEAVYFELLREIGRVVDLRVIVDIIAGASAGGINGTMLARALSHDLPTDKLRDLWLDNGDVSVLLAPEARARRWSKIAVRPLLWGVAGTGLMPSIKDREVRKNLSLFMRSRWFKPPLGGPCMSGLMYDAINAMGAPEKARASLLPSGQRLDLFVTLTDYHGQQHLVQIHDPPLIHEREHRHVLHFQYRRSQGGTIDSDFDLANAPALAFAARATSSFPGVFPPARIAEIDELVAERGAAWPHRHRFLEKNFPRYLEANLDPTYASFIDGSVLNNRPFREAITAIHGRPAYRQAERRLVYIEPNPALPALKAHHAIPGFFATLRGAISDLPRAQPVTDELGWVINFNDRMRELRGIIEGARPRVAKFVDHIISGAPDWSNATTVISNWRAQVNAQVAREAGFAYQGYVRLKLVSVIRSVSQLIVALRGVPAQSPHARAIAAIVEEWTARNGIVYSEVESGDALRTEETASVELADWAKFLLKFDVDYRKRRLNFLIEGQNRIYQLMDHERFTNLDQAAVNRLKRDFSTCLDALRKRQDPSSFSAETHALVAELFPAPPSATDVRNLYALADVFVASHADALNHLIERLAAEINLATSTLDVDLLLAAMDPAEWPPEARREVLVNYLGFPYWDVLTLPVTTTRESGEFREILVDRISPLDARTIAGFRDGKLKGTGFANFAGFLSRAYRENDYLLGRLHAVDRMIDIVCDAAGINPSSDRLDILAIKKKAFVTVLNAESVHLTASSELVASLRRFVHSLGTG